MLEGSTLFGSTLLVLLAATAIGGLAAGAANAETNAGIAQQIIAIEKAALDRWGNGDPGGYLKIFADEITYFDPDLERGLAGIDAMKELFAPIWGKIKVDRFEMINPIVQLHGSTAILTFNLLSYRAGADGIDEVASRWNSTEVYAHLDGRWKLVHSHWSHSKPPAL